MDNSDKNKELMFENKDKEKIHKEPGIHNKEGGMDPNTKKKFSFTIIYLIFIALLFLALNKLIFGNNLNTVNIDYSQFKQYVSNGTIQQVVFNNDEYLGYSITKSEATSMLSEFAKTRQIPKNVDYSMVTVYQTYKIEDPSFVPLLDEKKVEYYAAAPEKPSVLLSLLSMFLPIIVLFAVLKLMTKKMGDGAGVLSFNQNKSQIVAEGDTGVRFSDVAGCDESKQELEEVVDFLKNGDKYAKMGAKIPKGVLLVGPPGTGKTLLAKAVAGEAGVPFFKMSGADFVEMFVGVGAARVRDLFRQAREKSPCIIFIDEIDAIGRQRSAAGIGGNDEREQTLNQLLVEMDGFDARSGVIILAATNRAEILDPALLRPGRFDRQVLVDKPDLEGRFQILKVHTKGLTLGPDVNLRKIAQASAGLAGADLANICNEAALYAVRAKRDSITQIDFENAIEKSIAGLERKSRVLNEQERIRVAYHETGHALTAYMTKDSAPVSKISIVPRGLGALGYTLQYPTEDRFLLSEEELIGNIDVMLGGRAAEEVTFGDISTGASNDISRASDMVRRMICEYGMSDKFKNVTLPRSQSGVEGFEGSKQYSEDTQKYIDQETARIMAERYSVVLAHLKENQQTLGAIAQQLLREEVMEGDEFKRLAQEGIPTVS
jgi:ATP-dependent metalloprotease FtsH